MNDTLRLPSASVSISDLIGLALTYLRGIWTYRWIALLTAWILCGLGWAYVYTMPDVYEASARFYVDTSSRLRNVVRSLGMEPDVTSRVFLVQQALMGRPQLEKVARAADLDLEVITPQEYEAMLRRLRDSLNISTGRGREAQNLFTISYAHNDRQKAFNVVNELLNSFTNDILQLKNSDTLRAEQFLADQLDHYRSLLEQTEEKLQQFKREHPSYVIGNRGDYFARMQQQQQVLEQLQSERQVEASKQSELRRQLANVDPHAPVSGSESLAAVGGNETSQRLQELQRMRRDLLLRVTEKHPDVVALNEQIDELRMQLDAELAAMAGRTAQDGAPSATNPVYIEIQIALSNSNLALAELDRKIAQVSEVVDRLRQEVESAPRLEQEFVKLTRDYDNYQRLYNEVLNQSERERIGRVGEQKDVISFNIIEPTRVGLEPAGPNRPVYLAAVLVLGCGGGIGLALLLFLIRPTFHDSSRLSALTNLPVIGTVGLDFVVAGLSRRAALLRFGAAAAALFLTFVGAVLFEEEAARLLRQILETGGLA